jgi:hypothetical protein
VELRGGKGEVDGEGDVIAEFVPGGVGAEFDAGDLGGPVLREEDVVVCNIEQPRRWDGSTLEHPLQAKSLHFGK